MNNQTKIVICGSPHTGKTVFVTSLYKILPQKYTAMVRACLDGEGVYSNNKEQRTIHLTKRKGKMSPEFVQGIIDRISREKAPIVLVDAGGMRSEENEEIFSRCDMAIILGKTQEQITNWREFCQRQKLDILAELTSIKDKMSTSSITGEDELTVRGNICNLERGESKAKDRVVLEIRKRIFNIALEKGLVQKGMEALSEDNVLNMRRVAKFLKMINNDNIQWKTARANEIYYYVRGFSYQKDELKIFESRANWITGLVCEAAENEGVKNLYLYDARVDRYVQTQKLTMEGVAEEETVGEDIQKYQILPNQIDLYLKQKGDTTIMQFELNPKVFIKKETLREITLPNIDCHQRLYISGRLPLWLLGSIARTYENSEKSVFQPGIGFVQFSSNRSANLGRTKNKLKEQVLI